MKEINLQHCDVDERRQYSAMDLGYKGYHEQNACPKCKYYRMRWSDNICELFNRRVDGFGICDKFE